MTPGLHLTAKVFLPFVLAAAGLSLGCTSVGNTAENAPRITGMEQKTTSQKNIAPDSVSGTDADAFACSATEFANRMDAAITSMLGNLNTYSFDLDERDESLDVEILSGGNTVGLLGFFPHGNPIPYEQRATDGTADQIKLFERNSYPNRDKSELHFVTLSHAAIMAADPSLDFSGAGDVFDELLDQLKTNPDTDAATLTKNGISYELHTTIGVMFVLYISPAQ